MSHQSGAITEARYRQVLTERFGGVLHAGSHPPNGLGCALEVWSQAEGHEWTDNSVILGLPDVRPLNDGPWVSDAERTNWLIRVLVAVAPVWRDPVRRQRFVTRVALETVRQVLPLALDAARLPDQAALCRGVTTLQDAGNAVESVESAESAESAAWSAAQSAAWSAQSAGSTILTYACRVWIDAAEGSTEED